MKKVEKNKRASIKELIADMQKVYGFQNIAIQRAELPRTSTGIAELDNILGGGLVDGSIAEIYGPDGGGKETIALNCIFAAQAAGKECAFIDASEGIGKRCNLINVEHTFNLFYAKKIGVDTDELALGIPQNGERAFEMIQNLILNSSIDLIVINSVEDLVPQKVLESTDFETLTISRARLINLAMNKLVKCAKDMGCTLIFINRNRMTGYVNDHKSIGGNGLKSYSSVRIEVNKTTKNGVDYIKAFTVKNKTFPPFKTAEFELSR